MPGIGKNDLVSHLRTQFEAHADTRSFTFLNESGRHLVPEVTSFGDLDRDAREVAAWLSAQPEARRPVLLLFEPGIDFWRAFLGCLYAGVVAVPTPLPMDERSMKRVARILRDADSSLALTTAKLRDLLAAGIEGLDLGRPLRCVATDDAPLANADSWTMPDLTADTVAFLQYTSGSTGDPKGVVVSHGNVMNNEAAMSEAAGVTAASVLVGWIPHWHDMGLMAQLLAYFNGANLVTMSPLAFLKQPIRLLKAISDYRGTSTAAPNFAYDLIARRVTPEQLADLDLSCWDVALNGAEPVRLRTVERIAAVACSGRVQTVGDAPRIWHGRGDVDGHRQPRRAAPPGRRRRRPRTEPLYTGQRPRDRPGEFRRTRARRRGANRHPETSRELPEDQVGEIWLRSASVATVTTTVQRRRSNGFMPRPPRAKGPFCVRGPRATARRRAVCHRAPQRPANRQRPEPVPAGHRGIRPGRAPALAGSRGCAVSVDVDDAERLVLIEAIKTELLGDMSRANSPPPSRPPSRAASTFPSPAWCSSTAPASTSPPVERCSARRCGSPS